MFPLTETSTDVFGFACPSILVDITLLELKISNGFILINLSFKFINPLFVISKYSCLPVVLPILVLPSYTLALTKLGLYETSITSPRL